MKKTFLQLLSLQSLFFLFANSAAAQIGSLNPPPSIVTETADIGPRFLTNIIRLIIALAGIWALFQFLIGGFSYITGAGDAKKTQEAQQKIMHSIIGIGIIALSFILAGIIGLLFFDDAFFILQPTIEVQ